MLFVELRFVLFFAIVLAVAWALRGNTARKTWLFLTSCVFYGAWDYRFLGLIGLTVVIDYTVALALSRTEAPRRRRLLILVSLVSNLGILATFKYLDFFIDSGVRLLQALGVPASPRSLHIILPVGISFYTFQTLSYTIDVYARRIPAVKSFLDVAFFVTFFPQLVAGPIVRAKDFLPQLHEAPRFASVDVRGSLMLILAGFVKKACLSDNVAPLVDAYFSSPERYDAASAFVGVGYYAVQIYGDFSGYSDMALGLAGLLGYHLCDNFNFPYLAVTPADFWRRWHMSLSTWLRDYLYIPLGGNRGGSYATYRNLMLTMLLGGLWHGAAWTFVIWGGLHGLALVVQRALGIGVVPAARAPRALGWASTLYFTGLCWIFFRAQALPDAMIVLAAYTGFGSSGASQLGSGHLAALAALLVLHAGASRWNVARAGDRLPAPLFAVLWGALLATAWALSPVGYQPFIYFQF